MLIYRLALTGRDLDDTRIAFNGRGRHIGGGWTSELRGGGNRRDGRNQQGGRKGKRGSRHGNPHCGFAPPCTMAAESRAMP